MTNPARAEEKVLAHITSGHPELAEAILAEGVDVDHTADDGDSLLHKAVRNGNAALAARLLMYGADYQKRNRAGELALTEAYAGCDVLHAVRQHFHRNALTRETVAPSTTVHDIVSRMRQDGIARVEGVLHGKQLQRIQGDIRRLIGRMKVHKLLGKYRHTHYDQREYWHKYHRSFVFNDPLRQSETLAAFCETPLLREAADSYLGKTSHIKRVMGMRYLPLEEGLDMQQFGWHHDMEDRQFKVMVLLTDIGPDDQYMAYVAGTHRRMFDYSHFLTNKLTYEDCQIDPSSATEIHTTGKAGDVYLFDSNGMHRGTRSNGRMRDALFVEYTADRNWKNIWGTDMDERMKQRIREGPGTLLKEYVAVLPKWRRAKESAERRRPTWAESLGEPALWIGVR